MSKNPHAVALGKLGGSVKSERKKKSGQKNVAKALAARLAKIKPSPSLHSVDS